MESPCSTCRNETTEYKVKQIVIMNWICAFRSEGFMQLHYEEHCKTRTLDTGVQKVQMHGTCFPGKEYLNTRGA